MCTKMLVLLLLLPSLHARPSENVRMSAMAAAQRQARFGDFSFLCRLLCESVEEEDDCDADYPFDGSVFCEKICNSNGSTTTTTTMKPKKAPKPLKNTVKVPKTTPSPQTPKVNQTKLAQTATTKAPLVVPPTLMTQPTTLPNQISTNLPNSLPSSTVSIPSPVPIIPQLGYTVPAPISSSPIIPQISSTSSIPQITSAQETVNTPVGSQAPQTLESQTPSNFPTYVTDPTTILTLSPTSDPPAVPLNSPEAETATEVPSDATVPAPEAESTTATAEEPDRSKDLEISADEVDIVTVTAPTSSETSISTIKPAVQSNTTQKHKMDSLKHKLMPYMPELITLWCEYRVQFPTAETAEAMVKLCPKDGMPKSTAVPALYDLFLGPAMSAQLENMTRIELSESVK